MTALLIADREVWYQGQLWTIYRSDFDTPPIRRGLRRSSRTAERYNTVLAECAANPATSLRQALLARAWYKGLEDRFPNAHDNDYRNLMKYQKQLRTPKR